MGKSTVAADRKGMFRLRSPRQLLVAAALALLVWFAPALVAGTPLRHWVAGRVFWGVKGAIHVGRLSLGWLAPVIAEDVEFRAPQGEVFLTIPKVESGHSLLRLLIDLSDLGPFRCDQPRLKVVFNGKTSNLEQALAGYLQPEEGSSRAGLAVDLQVNGASVEITDKDTRQTWNLEPVHCNLSLPREPDGALKLKLDGHWAPQAKKFAAVLDWPGWGNAADSTQPMAVALEAEAFPLALLEPVVRRVDPGVRLAGHLDAAVKGNWTGGPVEKRTGQVEGTLSVRDLELAAAWLGPDQVRLKEIRLPLRARLQGSTIDIEKAELVCDCGQASLRGTLDASEGWAGWLKQPGWEVSARVDLPRLTGLLPHSFRRREGTSLTVGEIKLLVRSTAQNSHVLWTGNLHTTHLEGSSQGKKIIWEEPLLLDFRARVTGQGLPVVEQLRCKSSFLNAQASSAGEQWILSAGYDLGQLARQLGQFLDLNQLQLAGFGDLSAKFHASEKLLECSEAKLTLRNLLVQGPGLSFKEPVIQVQAAGKWDSTAATLELADTRILTESVNLQLPTLQVTWATGSNLAMKGNLEVQADLERLQRWLPAASAAALPALAGKLAGKAAFQSTGNQTAGQVDLSVTDLVAGHPKSPYWREPLLGLRAQGTYDAGKDVLHLARLQVEGAALKGDTKGTVMKATGSQELALQGELHYDLEKLDPIINLYIGSGVKFYGKGTSPLQVAGPLVPAPGAVGAKPGAVPPVSWLSTLQGSTSLAWKSANFYGMEAGPATAHLALGKGWLQSKPIQTTLSQGTLTLHPFARLEPGPMELYLTRGKIIEHARITPAMCAGALKYALPALAGMTEGEGDFSLDVQAARIPLADSTQADITGQFTIHQARIGAAPVLQELGLLLKVPAQAKLAQESVVPFRVVNGRVHHQKMELVFPELTIRTSGSVGFDGSLDLVAEFPVPPKWLPGGKIGQALANQTVTLPLRGTLQQPQLDRQALANASKQVLENAAKQLLQEEINNKLKKLFGPK